MRKYCLVVLAYLATLTTSLQAKEYWFAGAVCIAETSCNNCIEKFILKLTVDVQKKVVTARGNSIDRTVQDTLSRCTIDSAEKWKCQDLRGEVGALNGKLYYKYNPERVVVDGQRLELCLNE